MIDPKYVELIHRRLDGEITPTEDAELTQFLASSTEARALCEHLAQTMKVMSSVRPVDPPAGLKDEILASIGRAPARAAATPKRSVRELMMSVFTPRLSYGLAAGILLGIAIGVIGLRGLGGHGAVDPSSLVGTIISGSGATESRRIDNDSFHNDRFSGRLTVNEVQGAIWVRIELESSDDVSMTVSLGTPGWILKGFAQTNPIQSALGTTSSGLYLMHQGKNAYVFVFESTDQSQPVISVNLEDQGVVYQRDIDTKPGS
jgi:hypothetical protein